MISSVMPVMAISRNAGTAGEVQFGSVRTTVLSLAAAAATVIAATASSSPSLATHTPEPRPAAGLPYPFDPKLGDSFLYAASMENPIPAPGLPRLESLQQ